MREKYVSYTQKGKWNQDQTHKARYKVEVSSRETSYGDSTHNSTQRGEIMLMTCLPNLSAPPIISSQPNTRKIIPSGAGFLNQSLIPNVIIFLRQWSKNSVRVD